MKTFRVKMARSFLFPILAIAPFVAVATRNARAQESATTWKWQEKARIGVLLEERCESPATAENPCDNPPVVTSVVVNGPADRAGITSGDTLLAIDGRSVTSPAGREALLNLEAGVTVELQIGRSAGRRTIEVTPEIRAAEPYVDVRTMLSGPKATPPEQGHDDIGVRVVRIPSVRSRLGELEIRLDSLRKKPGEFVFFHQDSVGHLRVEVGDPEKAEVLLRRVGPDLQQYVWENEELAHRLEKVRDSALQSARVHLDSLVRLQPQLRIRGDSLDLAFSATAQVDPEGGWAYFVGPRRVSGQVRSLFLTDLRIAGAEFRELHGDLADYFEGTDSGLLVIRVIPGTPAARTGLREGDVVVEVNGVKCDRISTLREAMATSDPSEELQIAWIRKGSRQVGRLGLN